MTGAMFVRWELRRDDPRPVYRQIADEFHRTIGVEILKPGDALPAVRSLAAELRNFDIEHCTHSIPNHDLTTILVQLNAVRTLFDDQRR